MKQSGTFDKPFWEHPHVTGWIYAEWGRTVVIIEFPQQFVYIESNDPITTSSDQSPEFQSVHALGEEIPKSAWNEYWSFEPVSHLPFEFESRYYVSKSNLVAPAGWPDQFDAYTFINGVLSDPVGFPPFGLPGLAASAQGEDSAGIIGDYYAALGDDQEFYEFFSAVGGDTPVGRIYRYGQWLRGPLAASPNVFGLTTGDADQAHVWNELWTVNVRDQSWTFGQIINFKKTKEVEIFRTFDNFQSGHSPTPTVTLRAYRWTKFWVDPDTNRIQPYVPPVSEGEPEIEAPEPKWERTIELAAWPPNQPGNVSLGRFNSKGFAAPGDDLPE